MSSTVDVNVLLYASDRSSSFHPKALGLIERLAAGTELLYLFWPVVMGYLRIATHAAIFPRPLSVEAATENVEQLLGIPHARTAGEGDHFWRVYRATTAGTVVRGNLVPDAHLVSLMRENGVGTLWTHDRDFRKFEGIRVRDPFA
ncbi:MAG: TA system VapC family ribonuclease toxin [Candidatus Limnocylindria bacterium]